jgi:predicted transcriptional regulator
VLRIALRVLLVMLGLAACAGGFLWWKLRAHVEPVPSVLAAIENDNAHLRLPGLGGRPELVLGDLRGAIAYFVLEGRESMASGEGRELARALNRWQHGDDVKGYLIGEVEGLGFLKWKLDEIAVAMQRESRLPVYMDYDGALLRGFKLPKGHAAVVVLGKQGELLFRKSGKLTAAESDTLRIALGAREPDPPPPAPAFTAGPVSTASCAGKGCVLVFLAKPISVKDVPGIEGGKQRDDSAAWGDPDFRLVGMLSDRELPDGKSLGAFVGTLDGVKLATGWSQVADDAKLRAAFAISPAETAIVVVDREGRLALRERGMVAFWKVAPLDELLGLPARRTK